MVRFNTINGVSGPAATGDSGIAPDAQLTQLLKLSYVKVKNISCCNIGFALLSD